MSEPKPQLFVTVGTQGPFDRMVDGIDRWLADGGRDRVGTAVAQIGRSDLVPRHLDWSADLEPSAFEAALDGATHIVAHAGCGTILSALERGKPILVVPRRADLGEHRNDHQLDTAARFEEAGRIRVARSDEELRAALDALADWPLPAAIERGASAALIERVRAFLDS